MRNQVLQAALDVTHSQQERYLELADAYAAFVQRARQHKAEALARIGQVCMRVTKSWFELECPPAFTLQQVLAVLDSLSVLLAVVV